MGRKRKYEMLLPETVTITESHSLPNCQNTGSQISICKTIHAHIIRQWRTMTRETLLPNGVKAGEYALSWIRKSSSRRKHKKFNADMVSLKEEPQDSSGDQA